MSPPGRAPRRAGAHTRPSGIVTLLSDFGTGDPYVGIVKGVILGVNPAARLVDLTHTVAPQDVLQAGLLLETAYRFFPPGTVHLAVVDPGVGTGRRPLVLGAAGHCFVGPDNGLFTFLLDTPGLTAVASTDPRYHRHPVSRTFHARDVFAPVAAHCSRGVPLRRLGPPVTNPVRLPWPRPARFGREVRGTVLLADRFGNLLTSLTAGDLPGPPEGCEVRIAGVRLPGLVGTYGEAPPDGLGAHVDSSGRVEIFVRDGSAAARLGVGAGAPVSLRLRSATGSEPPAASRSTSSRSSPRRARRPSSRSRGPSFATRRGSR
jgi:hypothetical protein